MTEELNGEVVSELVKRALQLSNAEIEHLRIKLKTAKFVLAEREAELFQWKGPCSNEKCRLHYAHKGPCDAH